ncbi:peptide ABC transporter permease [Synergistales bacterium]|nr:peptide ABC transporter permease [Synergistales bacterium]
MIRYILKRILMLIPVLFLVLFIVFTINYFSPGDPVSSIVGAEATMEQRARVRESLGLNDSFIVRFGRYVLNVATKLDLGTDYITKRPVRDEIFERLPTTLSLTFLAIALASVVGITLGIISARFQYSIFDYMSTLFSLIASSMPAFWIGLMLLMVFALKFRMLPSSGFNSPRHWILPVATIAFNVLAIVTRNTRSSMLEVIRQDYITTARAKGLGEVKVIAQHALKNALIPVFTVIGVQIGRTLGNAVVVETVFSIPGLGSLMVTAVKMSNFEVVQGCIIIIALSFCVINLIVDLLYAFLDPRIKGQYMKAGKRTIAKAAKSGGSANG